MSEVIFLLTCLTVPWDTQGAGPLFYPLASGLELRDVEKGMRRRRKEKLERGMSLAPLRGELAAIFTCDWPFRKMYKRVYWEMSAFNSLRP